MQNHTESVRVKCSDPYNVVIGNNILSVIGETLGNVLPKTCKTTVIITDENVSPLYESVVRNSLKKAGFNPLTFTFPAGEHSKDMTILCKILEFLAKNFVTRSDVLIALGGGVVGDITGFAAGIYLRGIKYLQIPTTFLAAIDSSVGGKTAVNLSNGKNLAGVFKQPAMVFCDCQTFQTLTDHTFADGVAEAIKYGILASDDLFRTLGENGRSGIMEQIVPIVKECVEIKSSIVELDEFDNGTRQLLNLGHTVGHAVERTSNFAISHGFAVSAGLAIISRASARLGFCDPSLPKAVEKALTKHNLPINSSTPPKVLYNSALSDKKRSGDFMNIIIPKEVGVCEIEKIKIGELLKFIELGVNPHSSKIVISPSNFFGKNNGGFKDSKAAANTVIKAIPSKSDAHRTLIAAALSIDETTINLPASCVDIDTTISCLKSLGVTIVRQDNHYLIAPVESAEQSPILNCRECGTTLRFLIPVAPCLSEDPEFIGEGRLPERPIGELLSVLSEHGMSFSSQKLPLTAFGGLESGRYVIPGNVSSQYISGLLLALPLLKGDSEIVLSSQLESSCYVDMTIATQKKFGIKIRKTPTGFAIKGGQSYIPPIDTLDIEGDWSSAAYFLAIGAISAPVTLSGLNQESLQPDRRVLTILRQFGADVRINEDSSITVSPQPLYGIHIDMSEIPDLLPILAVVAAAANGETVMYNAERLKLKESDRLISTEQMIRNLGGTAIADNSKLIIDGTGSLSGGAVDTFGDHRIEMSAAAAASICESEVTINNALSNKKSYPTFYQDFSAIGGLTNVL